MHWSPDPDIFSLITISTLHTSACKWNSTDSVSQIEWKTKGSARYHIFSDMLNRLCWDWAEEKAIILVHNSGGSSEDMVEDWGWDDELGSHNPYKPCFFSLSFFRLCLSPEWTLGLGWGRVMYAWSQIGLHPSSWSLVSMLTITTSPICTGWLVQSKEVVVKGQILYPKDCIIYAHTLIEPSKSTKCVFLSDLYWIRGSAAHSKHSDQEAQHTQIYPTYAYLAHFKCDWAPPAAHFWVNDSMTMNDVW
jgi:hypothetical protein